MKNLSQPQIQEPIFECAAVVAVSGFVPGATIDIFAIPPQGGAADAARIGGGQASSASAVFAVDSGTVIPGARIYAVETTSDVQGENTSPVPTDAQPIPMVTVQPMLGDKPQPPILHEPLYECAECVGAEGVMPGAVVDVSVTHADGANSSATLRTNRIGRAPAVGAVAAVGLVPTPTTHDFIFSQEWVCNDSRISDPSSTPGYPVIPVPKKGENFLPAPEINEPVFACQDAIVIGNTRQGARVDLFIKIPSTLGKRALDAARAAMNRALGMMGRRGMRNPAPTPTGPAGSTCAPWDRIAMGYNGTLKSYATLTARQSLCSGTLVSPLSHEVTVRSVDQLPRPVILEPVYEGDQAIEISMTIAGEIVTVDESVAGTIAQGGAGQGSSVIGVLPLNKNATLTATVSLCNGSKTSLPVIVQERPKTILPPKMVTPLLACSIFAAVDECVPGARVRVYAETPTNATPVLIGTIRTAGGLTAVGLATQLRADWLVSATQEIGGKESEHSDRVPVRQAPMLPVPNISNKLYSCSRCVFVDNVAPGSRIDVYQHDHWIGGMFADQKNVRVPISPPLAGDVPIRVVQQLCNLKNKIERSVDGDSLLRAPQIISAHIDESSVRVGNLIRGAEVEIIETGVYGYAVGRGFASGNAELIPLTIRLFAGARLVARQRMCAWSDRTPVEFEVNYPAEWPLARGPYATASMEVQDIPFSDSTKGNASGHPYLANGNSAAIYFPATEQDGVAIADGGPFPLIGFAHAKRFPNSLEDDNTHDYRQLGNILDHLASWGFISIAPDVSWLYDIQRGTGLKDALDYILKKNDSDPVFRHKINREKIGAMGHSTGGAGAMHLATTLLDQEHANYHIQALALLASSNEDGLQLPSFSPHPVILIAGTEDKGGHGVSPAFVEGLYNIAKHPRFFKKIHGANHFHYTDSIDLGGDDSDLGNLSVLLPRENQQALARGYFTAFFRRYLQGATQYTDYLHLRKLEGYVDIMVDSRFEE